METKPPEGTPTPDRERNPGPVNCGGCLHIGIEQKMINFPQIWIA
jgi:hypothetical protein